MIDDPIVDGARVTQRASEYPGLARTLVIVDVSSKAAAVEFLQGIKALREEIAETFDPHIRRALESHRALLADKREAEQPLADAERMIKNAILKYDAEQDRARIAEQDRLRAVAQADADARRLDEAIAVDALARATGDVALARAADAILDAPIPAPVVAVPPPPRVRGVVSRVTWSGRLVDLGALVRYAAANPQFVNLLTINQPALNALARSMKGRLSVPGVEAVETRDIAAGKR
jgi:hypothetical protein